jgi:hypothetical protein
VGHTKKKFNTVLAHHRDVKQKKKAKKKTSLNIPTLLHFSRLFAI